MEPESAGPVAFEPDLDAAFFTDLGFIAADLVTILGAKVLAKMAGKKANHIVFRDFMDDMMDWTKLFLIWVSCILISDLIRTVSNRVGSLFVIVSDIFVWIAGAALLVGKTRADKENEKWLKRIVPILYMAKRLITIATLLFPAVNLVVESANLFSMTDP